MTKKIVLYLSVICLLLSGCSKKDTENVDLSNNVIKLNSPVIVNTEEDDTITDEETVLDNETGGYNESETNGNTNTVLTTDNQYSKYVSSINVTDKDITIGTNIMIPEFIEDYSLTGDALRNTGVDTEIWSKSDNNTEVLYSFTLYGEPTEDSIDKLVSIMFEEYEKFMNNESEYCYIYYPNIWTMKENLNTRLEEFKYDTAVASDYVRIYNSDVVDIYNILSQAEEFTGYMIIDNRDDLPSYFFSPYSEFKKTHYTEY